MISSHGKGKCSNPNQGLVPSTGKSVNTEVLLSPSNLIEQRLQQSDSSLEMEPLANMKIFTSVMLNAWRRRRADVQRLQVVVDRLKNNSIHTKNELHVSNTLMHVEKKRCQVLQLELKKSNLSINKVRDSCQMLSASLLSLTTDKQQLQQELNQSKAECGELRKETRKSKDDLLAALLEQRSLQQLLSNEQSLVQQLTLEKQQLLDELNYLRNKENDFLSREESYIKDLELRENTLRSMTSTIQQLEQELNNRSSQHNLPSASPLNEQQFSESLAESEVVQSTLRTRKQLQTFKSFLNEYIAYYGIDQFYKKLTLCTTNAKYLFWLTLLPHKSMRNGCMPAKIRFAVE